MQSNGRFINLKQLDNSSNPRVAAYRDYNYKFNPCKIYFNKLIDFKVKLLNEIQAQEQLVEKYHQLAYDNKIISC